LCLGTAGAGLNIDETVVGIERVGEHPPKFQALDLRLQRMSVGFDGNQGVGIVLFTRHVQQITGVLQAGVDGLEGIDNGFERFLLFAEILGALGIVPNGGVFEFPVDLL